MAVKVNTDTVKTTADQIKTINAAIDKDFQSVIEAVDKLHNNWQGSASSSSQGKFNNIKKSFYEDESTSRRVVLTQYEDFLRQMVSTDYESTETENTNLADMFK